MLSLQLVDPVSLIAVQTEASLYDVSGFADITHNHPGDWLGRKDDCAARLTCSAKGIHFNGLVGGAAEYFLEPCTTELTIGNAHGSAVTSVRLAAAEHVVTNLTSALVDNLKSLATLVALHWNATYTKDGAFGAAGAQARGTFVITNKLG
ncbi:unnamed protein product [Chrysoparadoxa australica]